MLDDKLLKYIESVASDSSTPGGGNVAGVINSLGCALMLMSLRIAVLKKDKRDPDALQTEKELESLKEKSLCLAREDSRIFSKVMKYWKEGGSSLHRAIKESAEVSLDISEAAFILVSIIEKQELNRFKNIITDVGIALELARAAYESGIMNFKINCAGLQEPSGRHLKEKEKIISAEFNKKFPALRNSVKKIIN